MEHAFHAQELLCLRFGQIRHRNARAHGYDICDILQGDVLYGTRGILFPLLLSLLALGFDLGLFIAQRCSPLEILIADGLVLLLANATQLIIQFAQLRRQRHIADAHASTGLIQYIDSLVRQIAVLDVAVGKLHRRMERFFREVHLMVGLVLVSQALHDAHGLLFVGLVDGERLEAPLKGRILLQMLAILLKGGGTDDLDLTARERGLQDGRRINGTFGRTSTDDGMDLIDEQQDIP